MYQPSACDTSAVNDMGLWRMCSDMIHNRAVAALRSSLPPAEGVFLF